MAISKGGSMPVPRFPASLCTLFIIVVAFAAAPTCARANDFGMPFGGKAASQPTATHFAAIAEQSSSAHGSAIRLASSIAHHEGHTGLGGNIAWQPTPRAVGMNEDEGGWRHHDDEGDDDGHKTPVPEPSTALLVFSGISALAGWRVRSRKQEITPTNLA
jgi:hypothetical protein